MKHFNIALLHYSCPPVVGGVEEVLRQQASLFVRYYNRVKIFAGTGEHFTKRCPIELNPLISSRNAKILNAHKLALENRIDKIENLSGQIYRYLHEELSDFDILIAHNVVSMHFNLPLTMALHRLADDKSVHIVAWNHDSPYFYANYPHYLDNYPWTILKEINPNIHYVVISESRRGQFAGLYGSDSQITVMPNGIDPIDFFRLNPSTLRIIQEEELFNKDLLMLQPCRLHPRKNIELSIKVTSALRRRNIKASLLVTGPYDPHEQKDFSYYKKLKSLSKELKVENDIKILAEYLYKSGERLTPVRFITRDLYLISDILFFPSWQEGFGLPILEAGMIKLPIVCSRIPPFEETGNDDVYFFELTDSPEDIADRILGICNHTKANRLFRRVINEYVWDNIYHTRLLPFLNSIT